LEEKKVHAVQTCSDSLRGKSANFDSVWLKMMRRSSMHFVKGVTKEQWAIVAGW
jgi:hypothetical protein